MPECTAMPARKPVAGIDSRLAIQPRTGRCHTIAPTSSEQGRSPEGEPAAAISEPPAKIGVMVSRRRTTGRLPPSAANPMVPAMKA